MEAYPQAALGDKFPRAPHQPSASWPLDRRFNATWWRNPNARGIAEPDPRTWTRGGRVRRVLASPCPHSKRRVRRERELQTALHQVVRHLAALAQLATAWPDAERPRALARELHEASADRSWVMTDPTYEGRTYERRSPLYLPRRASADAARFLRAHRAAVAFLRFAERQLEREAAERMRHLTAALRPAPSRSRSPITPDLDGERDIRSEAKVVEATEELKRVIDRIGRRFFDPPPPATT